MTWLKKDVSSTANLIVKLYRQMETFKDLDLKNSDSVTFEYLIQVMQHEMKAFKVI